MKIEKLDKDNVEEYIRDMKLVDTDNLRNNINKLNEFGIKKDDKFVFSFIPYDDFIGVSFGNYKIDDILVKEIFNFLNNNLSFDGHLLVEVYNDKVIDIMDSLYRVKNINVNKIIKDGDDNSLQKDKYADIDMRSIKYFDSKNNIFCNLYSQNIQDEDVIKKLDKFFIENNAYSIDFCILPDSLEYMESLGYKCNSKLYIID